MDLKIEYQISYKGYKGDDPQSRHNKEEEEYVLIGPKLPSYKSVYKYLYYDLEPTFKNNPNLIFIKYEYLYNDEGVLMLYNCDKYDIDWSLVLTKS